MARYPGADWRPLADGHQPAMARYDIVCLHTMVGNLTGTDRMFHQNGWSGTESHFGVGGTWGDNKDGVVYQWGDTRYRADANLNGNHRIVSIETGDNAPASASNLAAWTPRQVESISQLVAWICRTHDIPAVKITDSKPGTRGIGWHRLGIEHSEGIGAVPGYLVRGGERWSTSIGKECPGDRRVAQMTEIIRRVNEINNPPKAWSEMAISQASDVWNGKGTDMIPHNDPVTREPTDPDNPTWYPLSIMEETNRVVRDLRTKSNAQDAQIKAQGEALARIEALLTALPKK